MIYFLRILPSIKVRKTLVWMARKEVHAVADIRVTNGKMISIGDLVSNSMTVENEPINFHVPFECWGLMVSGPQTVIPFRYDDNLNQDQCIYSHETPGHITRGPALKVEIFARVMHSSPIKPCPKLNWGKQ